MGRAKELVMKVIPSSVANPFIRAHHYSGKVVNNSKLHFGVFLDGSLHGVMSYGPSLDKSKIIGLVADTGWNEFLELNRMAFDSVLPRNSESRAISMSIKLIRKYAPQVKWIISFADACSCGDGAIYRASNFVLTGIKENLNLAELPDGTRIHKMTLASNPTTPRKELHGLTFFDVTGGTYDFKKYLAYVGATPIPGFQLRYIYFIDRACQRAACIDNFSIFAALRKRTIGGDGFDQSILHQNRRVVELDILALFFAAVLAAAYGRLQGSDIFDQQHRRLLTADSFPAPACPGQRPRSAGSILRSRSGRSWGSGPRSQCR